MPVAAKYGTAMIIKIVPIQPSPIGVAHAHSESTLASTLIPWFH